MVAAIELQVISRIITSQDNDEIESLLAYDAAKYFNVFIEQYKYLQDEFNRSGQVPDRFEFQLQFPTINIVDTSKHTVEYLQNEMKENRKNILFIETMNKLNELASGDINDAWKYVENRVDEVNDLQDIQPMDIVHQSIERSNQIKEYAKQQRIPTGFGEIDKAMYGGLSTIEELLVLVARTNSGKAQPLWSPVLTPSGWTTMGELKVGDIVVGANNDNGCVVALFPQGTKDYYRIIFNDGTFAECCDDHLWTVLDNRRRERANSHYGESYVLTTKELRSNLDRRFSVDITQPIEFTSSFDEASELDGYLLGLLIGDGSLRDNRALLTSESEEIWSRVNSIIAKYNCTRSKESPQSIVSIGHNNNFVVRKLTEYGLLGKKSIDKFIPKHYLTAPVHVRKALLAGLVDTDGYIPNNSSTRWEFDTASEQLATDFAELARSLGVWVKISPRKPSYYIANGVRHEANGIRHLSCRSEFNPFWLSEKANRYHPRTAPLNGTMPKRHCKMIESIEYVGKTECQCILLDNVSHTYVTNAYTVTHNTWVCTKIMESAQANGFPCAYYSPEMQAPYLATRFDTWRRHFENSKLYKGEYSEEYVNYIADLAHDENTPAYVLEDKHFSGSVSVKVLGQFVKKHGIKLLIVDGISYMKDDENATRDQEKFKNIALGLFKLSKRYGCAVVLVMQANREVKSKDNKESIPDLFNTEGSDQPGRIATQAFGIRQVFEEHKLEIKLLKSRMANNQNPVFAYNWSINDGNLVYLEDNDNNTNISNTSTSNPGSFRPISFGTKAPDANDLSLINDNNSTLGNEEDFGDVEF